MARQAGRCPGIIPARAGFTHHGRHSPFRQQDHPRSRGVYLTSQEVVGAVGGIIPARAGFTRRIGPSPGRASDHPRSRGVYSGLRSTGPGTGGSSPLARGLRTSSRALRVRLRIIPARAGFTHPGDSGRLGYPDHPRSRGVYPCARAGRRPRAGSSPLARGLHASRQCAGTVEGIIPARAGFTTRRPVRCLPAADHPRSRGVYPAWPREAGGSRGSSPLARGLPAVRRRRRAASGIIPARAGFTSEVVWTGVGGLDHPRSRGVYSPATSASVTRGGSSPLARGLQGDRAARRARIGIIPARAGFTPRPSRRPRRRRDHPRSRGVY